MSGTITQATAVVFVALHAITSSDVAVAQHPMKIVDLLSIPWVSEAWLSP